MHGRWAGLGLLVVIGAGGRAGALERGSLLEAGSGGALTVHATGKAQLRWAPAGLDGRVRAARLRGEAFFNTPFVAAPSAAHLRDGLGPLFNSASCESCHNNLGRGRPAAVPGSAPVSLVVQLSARDAEGTWGAHPRYGAAFNPQGIPGVPPEGRLRMSYESVTGRYADGSPWALRKPTHHFEDLAYGPIGDAATSPRMGQSLVGLGLLEAIPESELLARADAADRDGDGISGRPNWIADGRGGRRLGRFGWKANHADVRAQIVTALLTEQGIGSAGTAASDCTSAQTACLVAPTGGEPAGVTDLDSIVTLVRTTPVPARRGLEADAVRVGAKLFAAAQCAECHVPAWRTGPKSDIPELADQLIHPFTDLLLHDMGPGMADGRPDRSATGSEWRTAPLWGIGSARELGGQPNFLHDDRARTLEEAILWHGGGAEASRSVFLTWTRAERDALIAFLESLWARARPEGRTAATRVAAARTAVRASRAEAPGGYSRMATPQGCLPTGMVAITAFFVVSITETWSLAPSVV